MIKVRKIFYILAPCLVLVAAFLIMKVSQENETAIYGNMDTMPLEMLYDRYRQDIEKNKPEVFDLAVPLARRGSTAADYMLARLDNPEAKREIRGIIIVLEYMKTQATFDPCGADDFYSRLVKAWKTVDPQDSYYNINRIEALCS